MNITEGFTHGGIFHADDVFATALLTILNPEIKITRGFTILDHYEGIVYDIGMGRYDHHQKDRRIRANGVPYAAFGLLWERFGEELVCRPDAEKFDEEFVQQIDQADNTGEANLLSMTIADRNLTWQDDPALADHAFEGALMTCFNRYVKENGGIFSQPQGWLILAEALRGHGNRAFGYFMETAPAAMNDYAEIRRMEPYCHGQFTEASGSPYYGRSHVHWLTGTASTIMVGCVEGILGMRPGLHGLKIEPAVPGEWEEIFIEKDFRGSHLDITIKNPLHSESGVKGLYINGKKMPGNYIPADELSEQNEIIVMLS